MYYNLLSEIKNAIRARKEKTMFPFSKMDFAIAKVIADKGYIKSVEKETVGRKNMIAVRLQAKDSPSAMDDFKIVSKPSRHFYKDYRALRPVKQGHGYGVLSTSKGIMTNIDARKQKIGGEYLFEIW